MVLGGNKRFRETQMGGAPPPIFVAGVGFSGSGFDHGAVGLRIVAAMSSSVEPGSGPKPVEDRKPKRSDPIPIRGMRVGPTVEFEEEEETATEEEDEEDDVELSESYTCVISHVGGGAVRKRVYVGDDDDDGIGGKFGVNSGVFFESPPPRPPVGPMAPGDFLSSCYLCRKKLHGLDIFMYSRGEAFCSADCRYQQILNDDYKEKCRSGAAKAREPFVLLPYRASLIFDAGVAAA